MIIKFRDPSKYYLVNILCDRDQIGAGTLMAMTSSSHMAFLFMVALMGQ